MSTSSGSTGAGLEDAAARKGISDGLSDPARTNGEDQTPAVIHSGAPATEDFRKDASRHDASASAGEAFFPDPQVTPDIAAIDPPRARPAEGSAPASAMSASFSDRPRAVQAEDGALRSQPVPDQPARPAEIAAPAPLTPATTGSASTRAGATRDTDDGAGAEVGAGTAEASTRTAADPVAAAEPVAVVEPVAVAEPDTAADPDAGSDVGSPSEIPPEAGNSPGIPDPEAPVDPAGEGADAPEVPVESPAPVPPVPSLVGGDRVVFENAAGAPVAALRTDGAADVQVSDGRFEVVDGVLRLREGISLDHETEPRLDLEIRATDADGLVRTETVEVRVADVNEAPTSMAFDPETPAPDTSTLTVRLGGEAYKGDPAYRILVDGKLYAEGTVTWAEHDDPDTAYAGKGVDIPDETIVWQDIVIGDIPRGPGGIGEIQVVYPNDTHGGGKADRNLIVDRIVLDGHVMEAEGPGVTYDESRVPDQAGMERMLFGGTLTFDTSGIGLQTDGVISENDPGAVIGRFAIDDPDAGDVHAFEVSDDRFEVAEGVLKLRDGVSLDHETTPVIDLEVRAVDAGGHDIQQSLRVGVGNVAEAATGLVLDTASVSELQEGAAVGFVDAPGSDTLETMTWDLSDDRFVMEGRLLKLRPGVTLDHEAEAAIPLTITGTDASGNVISRDFDIDVGDVYEPALPIGVRTGFEVDYFARDHDVHNLSQVDFDREPSYSDVRDTLEFQNTDGSFWEGGPQDRFALRATGSIDVPEGGTYTFRLTSDDGSRVLIDGQALIDNDGQHAMVQIEQSIDLEPGSHSMTLLYFESRGDAGLIFEMKAPGETEFSPVQGRPDFSSAHGETIPLNFDVDGSSEIHSATLSGLPDGTSVSDGDHALVTSGEDAEIGSWNLDRIEITPPRDFSGNMDVTIRVSGLRENGQSYDSDRTFTIEATPAEAPPEDPWSETQPAPAETEGWVEASEADASDSSGLDQDEMPEPAPDHGGEDVSPVYDHYG